MIFPQHLLEMNHFCSHFKDLWVIQNLTEIVFIPWLFSYSWSPWSDSLQSLLYTCGIRHEDRIGFQQVTNRITCLQFDHVQ